MSLASLWPHRENLLARWLLITLTASMAACGGGGGSSAPVATTPPADTATCDPDDATTADQCGVLYLAVTDADGDFLSYSVDVTSLTLQRANGDTVEALPNSSRIDFTDYVELTEFVSARNLPPGVYVAGSITLDYANAEIMIEKDGAAVPALVTDADGNPATTLTLDVTLADQDQLRLTRGLSSLLVVDFDLGASHTVDLTADPVTAAAEPIIVADIEPVDEKDVRVRGPLVDVDEAASLYTVQLRPFYLRQGDYGVVDVNVSDDTEYEIDGVAYLGTDGLAALALTDSGTPTRAIGTLNVDDRSFTAIEVLAGSSVPGATRDAVRGHVTSRTGNTLTVIGAAIIPSDRARFFNETVTVTIGDDTKVFSRGTDALLPTSAISVGQNVFIRGDVADTAADVITIDATAGSVRLVRTRVSGMVVSANPGQVDLDLASIGGRRPELFDFSGTGPDALSDADPDNYEIATATLNLDGFPMARLQSPTAMSPSSALHRPILSARRWSTLAIFVRSSVSAGRKKAARHRSCRSALTASFRTRLPMPMTPARRSRSARARCSSAISMAALPLCRPMPGARSTAFVMAMRCRCTAISQTSLTRLRRLSMV